MKIRCREILLVLSLLLFLKPFRICCYQDTGSEINATQSESHVLFQDEKDNPECSEMAYSTKALVAEVAIIADQTFLKRFYNNVPKMLEYVQALFVDVHTRFRTLPSINISFHVNEFKALEMLSPELTSEANFIVYRRDKRGYVDMRSTLKNFQNWMGKVQQMVPKFDIAMGLVAAPVVNKIAGASVHEGLCQVNDVDEENKMVRSAFVVSLWGSENIALTVAREIANLFGAKYDDHEECLEDFQISTEQFVMSRELNPKSTHFSSCSDKQMAKFLSSEKADCLRSDLNFNKNFYLSTYSTLRLTGENDNRLIKIGISAHDQCHMTGHHSNGWCLPLDALWKDDEETCEYSTRCISWSNCNLSPLDATPCGNGQRRRWCFRGKCVAIGVKFHHKLSNGCIGSPNQFSSDDLPEIAICGTLSSPIDLITIRDMGRRLGKFLVKPYTIPGTSEDGEKCLMLRPLQTANEMNFTLAFAKCPELTVMEGKDDENTLFGWHIVKTGCGYYLGNVQFNYVCVKAKIDEMQKKVVLNAGYCSDESGEGDPRSLWHIWSESGADIDDIEEFIDREENRESSDDGVLSMVGRFLGYKDEL